MAETKYLNPSRRYLSPNKAAKDLLGWTDVNRGRRLISHMKAKEKEAGKLLMHRKRHLSKTWFYVTEPMLRRYLPEFFMLTQDELGAEIRSYLEQVKSRLSVEIDERIAVAVEALKGDIKRIHLRIDTMQQRGVVKLL